MTATYLILASALFGVLSRGASAGQSPDVEGEKAARSRLVRVKITSEGPPSAEAIIINGRQLEGYQPRIIQAFPSTGVVIDNKGNVLTYVGYRWVDIPSHDPAVEIVTEQGQAFAGRLIGIDESAGVAVVNSTGGRLERTPVCTDCRVRDGSFLLAPVYDEEGLPRYQRVEVLSYLPEPELPGRRAWEVKAVRPPEIGEPLLDSERRVLGFVTGRRPPLNGAAGFRAVISPISQMLGSAEKILRAGGDIRTGWLGIYMGDAPSGPAGSIVVRSVEQGSPAQWAGLAPGDMLLRWNGKQIKDAGRFVQTIQETKIGSQVALEVLRQGRPMTVYPVIEPRRYGEAMRRFVFSYLDVVTMQSSGFAPGTAAPPGSWGGMTAIPLTQAVADGLRIPGQRGLLILNVDPLTPFAQAGLMGGDVILAVDDARINDWNDLYSHAQSRAREGRMVLKLFRRGSERNAIVQLPIGGMADERR
jgi:serine protease Do